MRSYLYLENGFHIALSLLCQYFHKRKMVWLSGVIFSYTALQYFIIIIIIIIINPPFVNKPYFLWFVVEWIACFCIDKSIIFWLNSHVLPESASKLIIQCLTINVRNKRVIRNQGPGAGAGARSRSSKFS